MDDPLESDKWPPVPSSLSLLPFPVRVAAVEALPWGSPSDSSGVLRLFMSNTGSSSNMSRMEFRLLRWFPEGRGASGLDDGDCLRFVLAAVKRGFWPSLWLSVLVMSVRGRGPDGVSGLDGGDRLRFSLAIVGYRVLRMSSNFSPLMGGVY